MTFLFFGVAILAGVISPQDPFDPAQLDLMSSRLPPIWETRPEDFPLARYQKVVKHSLAKKGMTALASSEQPIGFEDDWVTKRSTQHIEKLSRMGLHVVGDLEELRPVPQKGVDPTQVPVEDQLEAAVAALSYLVRMWPTP